jgi:hypothetical protein
MNFSLNSPPTSAAASTPASAIDPNEDILWVEFLNSLQEPTTALASNLNDTNISYSNRNTSSTYNTPNRASNNNNTFINIAHLIDNDDVNDDPDFTIGLDNCDLEDLDYMDECFHVPSKSFVKLEIEYARLCLNLFFYCRKRDSCVG